MGDWISVKDLSDLGFKKPLPNQKRIFTFFVENQDVTPFHELKNAMMLSLIIYIMN